MSTAGPSEAAREPKEPGLLGAGVADIPGTAAFDAVEGAPAPHRWGFGAYLLAETVFLGASVLLVWPYLGGERNAIPPLILLLGLLVPTVLAATVAIAATWMRGNGPKLDLRLQFEPRDIGQGVLLGCFGLLFTVPAAALWARVVGPDKANSAVGEMFAGHRFGIPMAIAVFLSIWLIAPICEEIVYRGLLWGAMERHGAARWWAFGLTTLCFALAHFEFSRTPLLLVIAVPIGLARLYTGRLGASIIAHQVNNLLPAVSLLLVMLGAVT